MPEQQYRETLYAGWCQQFEVEEILYEVKTGHQHLVIFRNAKFGRVLALDGIIQTTETDEFAYHEMLTHVPLFAHRAPRRVLIVGGGDGGILREVTRHAEVEHVTMVEIDPAVTEMAKQFLPGHSAGAFDDPRLNLVFDDGAAFVAKTEEKFDVIISDSTDPVGPGEVLFSGGFYAACHQRLNPGGILVTQNGVPFLQPDEVRDTSRRLAPVFADHHFYQVAVPTYVGGLMTLAWASDDASLRQQSQEVIAARFAASGLRTRYYNPGVHVGAFHLPQFILDGMAG
ncbi:polyamine aminopropyltransferase [Mangrovimicrobium sediminis]|uniref:Polyamine aminopropyltransferase n=1 Tax=Mangrovimicrobium sediminis TaxID=2562682 RepID=A0A4Z0LYC8_9GAMM|nr:polyamine aminopropyltransferase [Haliea sp. SAOS-164]TGD72289.1 polyamine aminopropyltransferase [Haliea sp. SAOS-164]